MKKLFTLYYRKLKFLNFYSTIRIFNKQEKPVHRFCKLNCKYEIFCNSFQNREYSVKFYSHPFERKTTFSHLILDYIRTLPEYSCKLSSPLPIAYNERNAIEQLHSVIIHSLPPEQNDVIKLFSMYVQSSRSTLSSVLLRSKDAKKLQAKFESSIFDMSDNNLLQLAKNVNMLRYLRWNIFIALSSDIYDECLKRVIELPDSVSNILKNFIITMELYGDSVYKKNGYDVFIKCFENCVHEATPQQIVQMLHFIGLTKKQKNYSSLLWLCISHLSPKIKDISFIDAGIASAAVYKLEVKLVKSSSFVTNIGNKLNERLIKYLIDPASLSTLERYSIISILKNLRFSDYHNTILLANLRLFLMKCDISSYDPPFICNCLAYFSNNNSYNEALFALFENKFFQFMESPDPNIRLKDLSRAIWAFSNVNHPCKPSNLNLILNSLHEIMKTADALLGTKHLVDSLLALSVYGKYDKSLIKTIFCDDFTSIMKEDNNGRPLSRLFLLYHIYKTYFPELDITLPDIDTNILPHRTIADELNFRPALKHINNALDWLNHECGAEVLKLRFLVPHIHNASLVISDEIDNHQPSSKIGLRVLSNLKPSQNSKILIDLNDSHISVNGSDNLIGLETLKRNILQKQGWNIKIVTEKEITNQNNDITAIAALLIEKLTNRTE